MLCDTCKGVFESMSTATWDDNSGRPRLRLPHHSSLSMFEISAQQGCFICSTHLRREHPKDGVYVADITRDMGGIENNEYRFEIGIVSRYDHSKLEDLSDTCFFLGEATEDMARLSEASLSTSTTGSPSAVSLAKHWLSTCESQHASCSNNLSPTWYPTRLLGVTDTLIQLISTKERKSLGPYVTLSHCWGTMPFRCLSTENLYAFEKGLPLWWFPRTFQNVMTFVNKLGFRYLWIDCYCILQHGTPEEVEWDKSRELATMKKVYANSHLNIGASHGSSPFSGSFVERDRWAFPALGFSYRQDETYPAKLEHVWCNLGQGDGRRYYQIINRFERSDREENFFRYHAIFMRAWILQERMLSSRMLHFGDNQLHWECSGYGYACEEFPHGPGEYGLVRRPPFSLTSDRDIFGERAMLTEGSWWRNIVEAYSQLSLTYPEEDKLVALSGIAERAAQVLAEEYIAGFFRGSIVCDLYFEFLSFQPSGTRYMDDPRLSSDAEDGTSFNLPGPSWSWASRNFAVQFRPPGGDFDPPDDILRNLVTLRGHEVRLLDSNVPYGAVSGASLVLSGRLIESAITQAERLAVLGRVKGLLSEVELSLDDHCASRAIALGSIYEILLLYTTHQDVRGLLLRKEPDGAYSRIGVVCIESFVDDDLNNDDDNDDNEDQCEALLTIWNKQEEISLTLK